MSGYRLISADSHFVEPPKMWAERPDRRFRDRAPHRQATFPRSQDHVVKHLSKVSEADRREIVRNTAAKLYGLN